MEHRASAAGPVKRRLSMQNEILKRVEELVERMQRRAEEVTREMRDLEGRAGAAERDLGAAFDAFRRLSDTHFVENIIHEDSETSHTDDRSKTSVDRNIPAQSYEVDILPRYKDAVLLGLRSYEDHMKMSNKRYSTRSTFNPWSVRGPLPHIIGSEEYIHDNSCGLIDDLVFGSSFDSNDTVEPERTLANTEPNDLSNTNPFGMEKGPSEKSGNEPLVSAALDFKAMLEAALRSPYKFYDEETSSHAVVTDDTWTTHTDQVTLVSENIQTGSSGLWGADGTMIPVFEGHSYVEGSDMHTDNISTLISGSLFDAEETSPVGQEQSDNIADLVEAATHGYAYVADEMGSIGSIINSPVKRNLPADSDCSERNLPPDNDFSERNLPPDNDHSERHHSSVSSAHSSLETGRQEGSLEDLAPRKEDITCETHTTITDNVIEDTKLLTIDESSIPHDSKEGFISKSYPD